MPARTDVIVIGAGSAGLSAARELKERGVSHIVVEAAQRIGGRACSVEIAPDTWFDLGCAYLEVAPSSEIHIETSNPYITFARNQGVDIEEYRHGAHYVYNGRPLDEAEVLR